MDFSANQLILLLFAFTLGVVLALGVGNLIGTQRKRERLGETEGGPNEPHPRA